MTNPIADELVPLLSKALQNLVFKSNDQTPQEIKPAVYRDLPRDEAWNLESSVPPTSSRYRPVLHDDALMAALKTVVRKGLKTDGHADRFYIAALEILHRPIRKGVSADLFVEQLVTELLAAAAVDSPARAAEIFAHFVGGAKIRYRRFIFLAGVDLDADYDVCDGIKLLRLPKDVKQLPYHLPESVGLYMPMARLSGGTILAVECAMRPPLIVTDPEASDPHEEVKREFHSTVESDDSETFDFRMFCKALALSSSLSVTPVFEWSRLAPEQIVGSSRESGLRLLDLDRSYFFGYIGEYEIDEGKETYEALVRTNSTTLSSLKIPIDRWMRAQTAEEEVQSAIDLGIALEALYLNEQTTELSYRLRLRIAWHLGYDKESRINIMKGVSELYRLRSDAVHKGKFTKKSTKGIKSARETLGFVSNLCRMGLLKVIYGEPLPKEAEEWDRFILG